MRFKLDRRTRRDEDRLAVVSPDDFFTTTLPAYLAQNGAVAAAGYKALSARPLTIEVGGAAWSLVPVDGTLSLVAGQVPDALVVSLSAQQFTDWTQNQLSFNGMMTARNFEFRNGSLLDVSVWDSLWIAILEGWPLVDPGLAFRDRHGKPLDLEQSFAMDDDPADIAHFLREAGFAHLRGWVDPSLIGSISAEMDAARPHYAEGDGKSWWAELSDGSRTCVRMQEFVDRSPSTAQLLKGPIWEKMVGILEGDEKLARKPVEGRIIEALFKPVNVVSGPSDLSFHRDCHLGRHSYACARMTIGVAISASNRDNGQLRVVAGSHRLAMPVEIAKAAPYLPVVALTTQPGDMTVHLSCTLHEATAPASKERRVMYTEIPLAGRLIDTSVSELRERVNDLIRGSAP
ncbi:phytanoyl-CoA dioxygenase family protein [Novosphingobium sp. BL-8A]|uniref:phytanoyl-CoA dioxygenase family protein n=1 Tax=Novosphingobium sp. BL-8A TaxID=3127639 RepID=UPI003756951C